MADPYATRTPDLSGRPTGPSPWRGLVEERGGAFVGADGAFDSTAAFAVIDCAGMGTLAPFSRVDAPLGTLLWIEHTPSSRFAASANALLGRLRDFDAPTFAIKHGCVGGPADRPGRFEIDAYVVGAALEGALAGEVRWEIDPDFGYEVLAHVPGIEGEGACALMPRLLYANHDRVYEHAGLVAAKKRERAAIAANLSGLDAAIASVSGWPPHLSAGNWRE